jgi:hypothetical protein
MFLAADNSWTQAVTAGCALAAGIASSASGSGLTRPSLAQVRFRLTPQLIHQTFAEKPAVRRAFTANVPHNMDEKAFWTKYLRQQLKEQVRSCSRARAQRRRMSAGAMLCR